MPWRPLPEETWKREPTPLGTSLNRLAASLGAARPALLGAVFSRWDDLVGPEIAAHARPRSLRDGVLTVVTDHPAWATSLRLLSGEVLARIAAAGAAAGAQGAPGPSAERGKADRGKAGRDGVPEVRELVVQVGSLTSSPSENPNRRTLPRNRTGRGQPAGGAEPGPRTGTTRGRSTGRGRGSGERRSPG